MKISGGRLASNRHGLIAFTGCLMSLSATAQAQVVPEEQSSESSASGSDIIVTARRREERLQDVPLAVAAFSNDDLDRRVINTGEDLGKLDPAIQAPASFPRSRFAPRIRGQAASIGSGGQPQSVITYLAEAPNIQASFFDLANVQIIKGPQGTLFGETATGGAVLLEPQRPGDEFSGYAQIEGGNHEYLAAEFGVTVPILQDVWSIRAAGQIRKREGYTAIFNSKPGLDGRRADNVDKQALRISSLLKPLPDVEIYSLYIRESDQSNGTGAILNSIFDGTAFLRTTPAANPVTAARFQYFSGYAPLANTTYRQMLETRLALQQSLGKRAFTADYDLSQETKYQALINHVSWQISDNVQFKNITSWQQAKTRGSGFQIDGSDLPIVDSLPLACVPGTSPKDCLRKEPQTFTNEARLNGTLFDNRLDWQGGFYYRKVKGIYHPTAGTVIVSASPTSIPTAAARCTAVFNVASPCTELSKTMSESYAVYGQVTFEVVDDVHLTAGYRRTWDYTRTTNIAAPYNTVTFNGQTIGQAVLGTRPISGSLTNVTVIPRNHNDNYTLGADWKVSDNLMVYVQHRKGYKAGGVNANITPTAPEFLFGPEKVKDVEIGAKASVDLGGGRLQTNIALYKTDYGDIQRRTSRSVDGSLQTFTSNVAAAKIKGVEWNMTLEAGDYISLNVGYAYTDAKFDRWLESTTCQSDPTATGCGGVPNAAVPVLIDHAEGTKTAAGITDRFKPDLFLGAPKHRLSVQPILSLGFLGDRLEKAALSGTMTYTSRQAVGDSNYSTLAPTRDVILPAYTLFDARFDWKGIAELGNANLDFFASVVNVTNATKAVSGLAVVNLCGCTIRVYNEPRMFVAGLKASF